MVPPAAQFPVGPVALVGTIAFLIAFLVLLPFYGWLGEHGHRVWLWTSLAGFVEGLAGASLAYRHRLAGRTI